MSCILLSYLKIFTLFKLFDQVCVFLGRHCPSIKINRFEFFVCIRCSLRQRNSRFVFIFTQCIVCKSFTESTWCICSSLLQESRMSYYVVSSTFWGIPTRSKTLLLAHSYYMEWYIVKHNNHNYPYMKQNLFCCNFYQKI